MEEDMALNVGCGNDYRESSDGRKWINLDQPGTILKREPEIRFNLNKKRWDFEDETFDYVYCSHVLEHLEDPINSMNELTRILKPKGLLLLKIPHFSRNLSSPVHTRAFGLNFYQLMVHEGYINSGLELKNTIMRWERENKKSKHKTILSFLIFTMSLLANLNQFLCERVWCYWVGGFSEMEFLFRKNG